GFTPSEINTSPPLRAATIRPNAYSLIARPCCQTFLPNLAAKASFREISGDTDHHDKPSSRAACHDCPDRDAIDRLAIACAERAAGHRPCQGGRRKAEAAGGGERRAGRARRLPPPHPHVPRLRLPPRRRGLRRHL